MFSSGADLFEKSLHCRYFFMLSIVMPIYNMARYLEKALLCLENQTDNSFEVILVDDGSMDCSSLICDEFASKYHNYNIRVIHKKNGGLSSARNVGMEAATGDYIVFPDPDDWVERNYVEQFNKKIDETNSELIYLGYYINYDDGREVECDNDCEKLEYSSLEAIRHLFIHPEIQAFAWNKGFNLEIIKNNHLIFRNEKGMLEDLDFLYRYLKLCKTISAFPNVKVYHYYQSEEGCTRGKFKTSLIDSLNVYQDIVDDVDDIELKHNIWSEYYKVAVGFRSAYLFNRCDDEHRYTLIRNGLKRGKHDFIFDKSVGIKQKIKTFILLLAPRTIYYVKGKR